MWEIVHKIDLKVGYMFSLTKNKYGSDYRIAATHAWYLALDGGIDICCVIVDQVFEKVPHILIPDRLADIGISTLMC